ncbi:MAG: SDR family oxidoreductase [Acidobacteria bacterium]|nr:SDR family oxidoreductase [Acidobacteriota bacterium]
METSSNFIVFGATGGVGSTLSRRLRDAGHSLFLAGRDTRKTKELASGLKSPSGLFEATRSDSVTDCFQQAQEELGRIDGIAHCVGSLLLKPAHLKSPAEWEQAVAVNLTSAFYVLRAAAPAMRKNGGSVVFVSSAAARVGLANHEAIAATKAGLIGLVLSAAATYGPHGMRVNCVAPGLVDTPLTTRIMTNERSREASRSLHVLGRIGRPDDVASAMHWLLDANQSWVTGQVIGVDGGLGTVHTR